MAADDDDPDALDQFKRATALWSQAIQQAADEGIPQHVQMIALGLVISGACLMSDDAEGTFRLIERVARDAMQDKTFTGVADRLLMRHRN